MLRYPFSLRFTLFILELPFSTLIRLQVIVRDIGFLRLGRQWALHVKDVSTIQDEGIVQRLSKCKSGLNNSEHCRN